METKDQGAALPVEVDAASKGEKGAAGMFYMFAGRAPDGCPQRYSTADLVAAVRTKRTDEDEAATRAKQEV